MKVKVAQSCPTLCDPMDGIVHGIFQARMATSSKELTHWKRLWCWEGLGAGGKGDNRGWDGWMASLTRWTWVWVNSESWWWTGRPGVLRFMGLQRVGHDWVTELNWTECHHFKKKIISLLSKSPTQLSQLLSYYLATYLPCIASIPTCQCYSRDISERKTPCFQRCVSEDVHYSLVHAGEKLKTN